MDGSGSLKVIENGVITMPVFYIHIFGRPFVKWFALCYLTVVCPVCNVGVLWPNGWMDQDATWHGDRPWLRPHSVRWEPSCPLPPKKKGTAATLTIRPMSILVKRLGGSR